VKLAFLILVSLVISGCASKPSTHPTTGLTLKVTASSELNPDAEGRPSPVVLRLYELAKSSQFMTSDFFEIYDGHEVALGTDLIAFDEYLIHPGQVVDLRKVIHSDSESVGLLAAYHDLDRAQWRKAVRIRRFQNNEFSVLLDSLGITVAGGGHLLDKSEQTHVK
jgi:type VI secretion system protein VasD